MTTTRATYIRRHPFTGRSAQTAHAILVNRCINGRKARIDAIIAHMRANLFATVEA